MQPSVGLLDLLDPLPPSVWPGSFDPVLTTGQRHFASRKLSSLVPPNESLVSLMWLNSGSLRCLTGCMVPPFVSRLNRLATANMLGKSMWPSPVSLLDTLFEQGH